MSSVLRADIVSAVFSPHLRQAACAKKNSPKNKEKKLPLCGKKKGDKNFGCKAAKKYFIAFLIDNAHYDRCL